MDHAYPRSRPARRAWQAMGTALSLLLATTTVARGQASQVLDDFETGELASWEPIINAEHNPVFAFGLVTSPFNGSTGLRTTATGITLDTCWQQRLSRTFPIAPSLTNGSSITGQISLAFDGSYYNLPYVRIVLFDGETELGSHAWYGNGVIGGYFTPPIENDLHPPTNGATPISPFGPFLLDLTLVAANSRFDSVAVQLVNYTCVGTNETILDDLSITRVPFADGDNDGVQDSADNCPTAPNSDQSDRDSDTIGDTCDPFPDSANHEHALCAQDLDACEVGAEACDIALQQATGDSDSDGVPDRTDQCPSSAGEVDLAGCTLAQFCGLTDATTAAGRRTCRRADWKNDEPLMTSRQADCKFDRGAPTVVGDEICVAAEP